MFFELIKNELLFQLEFTLIHSGWFKGKAHLEFPFIFEKSKVVEFEMTISGHWSADQ